MNNARLALDRHLPSRGQCGICGVPGLDARHRVIDAIDDHAQAGESADDIADELGLTEEAVIAVLRWCADHVLDENRGPWLEES